MVVSRHSKKSVAYPAQSFFVRVVGFLALSFLLPASSCPLLLLRAASSASTLQLLATAVEEQVKDPWVGLEMEVGLVVGLVRAGEVSWLPVEADHDGVST